jgi:hypothetical protein
MIIMNVSLQKELIIKQFRQVNDENLIRVIKSMLDYASEKEKQAYLIPDDHQRMVLERFEEVRKNPDRLLEWEEAKKRFNPDEKL